MGFSCRAGISAATCAAVMLLGSGRALGETTTTPIARLTLEGGWDSNALLLGEGGDQTGRVSPDLGFRIHGRRLDLSLTGGADFLYYQHTDPRGTWNPRGALKFRGITTRRVLLEGSFTGSHAYDPAGLAQMGIFLTGRQSVTNLEGRGRAQWRASEEVDAALTLKEQTIHFDDGTGGAVHAPGVEALWRLNERLSLGGAAQVSLFQSFAPTGDTDAFATSGRARLHVALAPHSTLEASAGPALWNGPGHPAWVPEGVAEVYAGRDEWDLRATVFRGLGIGATAAPAIVTSAELALDRRFWGDKFVIRGIGGLWRSGMVPSDAQAIDGYALTGEASYLVGAGVRVGVGATNYARLDNPSPIYKRTTVGLRVGWELGSR